MTLDQLQEKILDRINDTSLGVFIIDAFEQYRRSQNSGKPMLDGAKPEPLALLEQEWNRLFAAADAPEDVWDKKTLLRRYDNIVSAIQLIKELQQKANGG